MKQINEEKKYFIKDIKTMKYGSIEEMALIIWYSLISYFKSLISFGKDSNITKDNLNVIKEMFNILKLENKLLNYILRQVDKIDVNAGCYVIDMLNELNSRTVRYYYDVIDDIETAAEMHCEFRALRPRNTSPTLIQTYSYATEVIALSENIESLKMFLGFEDEFWNYIKSKVEIVEFNFEGENDSKVEPILENEIIVDISLKVPKIVNLQTALIAIKEYKIAYGLYKMIGCRYEGNNQSTDVVLQKKYSSEYLVNKAKSLLHLKNVM